MIDSEKYLVMAEKAAQQDKFLAVCYREVVAGWLRYNFRCVYCGKDLLESWETFSSSLHHDHLLPKKYPPLLINNTNIVPACAECNQRKSNYDANLDLPESLRYTGGPELSDNQHREILRLCKIVVIKRREDRRHVIEHAIATLKSVLLEAQTRTNTSP